MNWLFGIICGLFHGKWHAIGTGHQHCVKCGYQWGEFKDE